MECVVCKQSTSLLLDAVFECNSCHHIYREVNVDDTYYSSGEYRKTHPIQDIEKRQRWIRNIVQWALPVLNQCNSVLEIGSGDGLFISSMINLNKKVGSCELDPTVAKDYTWTSHIGNFASLFINDIYDLTAAIDVLEHFENPHAFFDRVNSLYLLLQVPVNRRIVSPKEFPDTHYHYFNLRSLNILAEKHQFYLLSHLLTDRNFSANGPELLTIYRRA